MKAHKFKKAHNKDLYVLEGGDVIHANPLDVYYREGFLRSELFLKIHEEYSSLREHDYLLKASQIKAHEFLNELRTKKYSCEKLNQVLLANKKKDQIKILKNLSINPMNIANWSIKAWEDHKFTFSRYKFSNKNKGDEGKKLPKIIQKEGNELFYSGDTDLTNGELRHAVEHQNRVLVYILDNGRDWHCLFNTFKGVTGKERHAGGAPHFHYISNKWGLTKNKILDELSSPKYSLPSTPHIIVNRN